MLAGRALEFERDLPFAVWIDALDEYLRALEDAPAAAVGGEHTIADLAGVLPSLRRRGDAGRAAPLLDERHLIHSAMRALLEAVAGDRGLVLILDDMHWADAASVDLVAALLRRPPAAPVLIAVAMRPHQAPARLASAMERAERDAGLVRVDLAPLSRESSDALVGDAVSAERRAALYEESGGNPFYLEHLARAEAAGAAVPRGVSDAITEELRELPEQARHVIEAAAVAGDPFEPDLVAAAAGMEEGAVLDALDLLQARDLIRPTPVPRRFTMRHPLVRRAVYDTAGAGWRLTAHARAADALRDRGAPAELRAHHVARSARPGDAEAVALLAQAAASTLDSAPATAATWLRTAADLEATLPPDPARRVGILVPLSRALLATGQMEEGREALTTAAALVPAEDTARRAELASLCAGVEHRLGHHDDARARLRQALGELPEEAGAERVMLLLELAADGFYRGDVAAMEEHGTTALAAAEELADRPGVACALALIGLADTLRGRNESAIAGCRAASDAFEALSDAELARRLDTAHYLVLQEMYLERLEECAAHAGRGLEVARASRQGTLIPVLTIGRGFSLAMLGRLTEAAEVLDGGVEAARLSDSPLALGWVLGNSALVSRLRGDVAGAVAAAEEAVGLMAEVDDGIMNAYAAAEFGEGLLAAGNAARAAQVLTDGCGGPELPLILGFWRCHSLGTLAEAQLETGDADAAAKTVELAERHAEALAPLTLPRGWARQARAVLDLGRGDPGSAAEGALRAADDLHRPGAVVDEGFARVLAGRSLGLAGRRDEALAALQEALAIGERTGAELLCRDAARELRRLGHRPTRGQPSAEGLAALSGREREVAELICDGRTNAEIASALYLSKKTVETHIRNVFGKLRVASRLEVARIVERERMGDG